MLRSAGTAHLLRRCIAVWQRLEEAEQEGTHSRQQLKSQQPSDTIVAAQCLLAHLCRINVWQASGIRPQACTSKGTA